MWNRCGDNDQIAKRDLKLKFIFYQKSKDRRGKGKTHTQVQKSDFHDSAKVKAEMV